MTLFQYLPIIFFSINKIGYLLNNYGVPLQRLCKSGSKRLSAGSICKMGIYLRRKHFSNNKQDIKLPMHQAQSDDNFMYYLNSKDERHYKWSDQLILIQECSLSQLTPMLIGQHNITASPNAKEEIPSILETESKFLGEDLGLSEAVSSKTDIKRTAQKKSGARLGCNCKKTQCLKSYCDCFASGKGCSPQCRCLNCQNREDHQKVVQPQPAADTQKKQFKCKCKKSQCRKKYCECFSSGVGCGSHCSCNGCQNHEALTSDK